MEFQHATSPNDRLVEDRYTIVPTWLLDHHLNDAAMRHAVVERYGQSSNAAVIRWVAHCSADALRSANPVRHSSTQQAADALRRVAADPESKCPMRLAEAGVWWDEQPPSSTDEDVPAMEKSLIEADDGRVRLQSEAWRQRHAVGLPINQERRHISAYRLLRQQAGAA